MPQRFPPLAPQNPPPARRDSQLLQALPMGELCLLMLIGLALVLT